MARLWSQVPRVFISCGEGRLNPMTNNRRLSASYLLRFAASNSTAWYGQNRPSAAASLLEVARCRIPVALSRRREHPKY